MHHGIMWMIFGLALLIIEILSTTFFLMWLGAAALLTALLSIWVEPTWIQWTFFAVSSLVLLVITRPMARRIHDKTVTPSNVDRLVGEKGIVLEAIDPLANTGRVRVHSEEWRARSESRVVQGAQVTILRVEGTTLWVEAPAETEQASPEA